jgi:ABC-type sugar transport system ATPase subunit
MTLSTKICLLNNGVLQQYEAPLDIYRHPINIFASDFVGNPSINFIKVKAKQISNEIVELTLFNKYVVQYKLDVPGKILELSKNAKAEFEAKEKAEDEAVLNGKVEKSNKDVIFPYKVSVVDEAIEAEKLQEFDFVLGIRPEHVVISKSGAGLNAFIYSAMPSGVETIAKVQIDSYLLTSIIFGSVNYPVNEKVKISFSGHDILLFDKTVGKLLAGGSIDIK